jgi:carboxypeptidase C (cathepsin A)
VKFPERKGNPLWVSGESYGGIYVPYLTWQIYQHNLNEKLSKGTDIYNLKGFMVGNGATNWDFDVSPSFPETVYNFNLIPKSLIDTFNSNYCVIYFNGFRPDNGTSTETCDKLFG